MKKKHKHSKAKKPEDSMRGPSSTEAFDEPGRTCNDLKAIPLRKYLPPP
jgi:hypothetical protein